jgi:hypothetical protein
MRFAPERTPESDSRADGTGRPFDAPWLHEVLETIGGFGTASLGLVAWELSLPEQELDAAWRAAERDRLIRHVGRCDETGEALYALAIRTQRAVGSA